MLVFLCGVFFRFLKEHFLHGAYMPAVEIDAFLFTQVEQLLAAAFLVCIAHYVRYAQSLSDERAPRRLQSRQVGVEGDNC